MGTSPHLLPRHSLSFSHLLSPSSCGALSLPLPLFFFLVLFLFSFSFTADPSLSLTGAQGPPSQGAMRHPPGSFFFLFLFHLLTSSLLSHHGDPCCSPLCRALPLSCCPHLLHVALVVPPRCAALRHVALASVALPSSCRSRTCFHCIALVALLQAARLLGVARFKARQSLWTCSRNGGKGVNKLGWPLALQSTPSCSLLAALKLGFSLLPLRSRKCSLPTPLGVIFIFITDMHASIRHITVLGDRKCVHANIFDRGCVRAVAQCR